VRAPPEVRARPDVAAGVEMRLDVAALAVARLAVARPDVAAGTEPRLDVAALAPPDAAVQHAAASPGGVLRERSHVEQAAAPDARLQA